MNSAAHSREERTARLAELRAREAARKVVLRGKPLMEHPLVDRIAFATFNPGSIIARGDDYQEPVHRWQARAVVYVLDEENPSQPETVQAGVRVGGNVWLRSDFTLAHWNNVVANGGVVVQRTIRYGEWTEVSA